MPPYFNHVSCHGGISLAVYDHHSNYCHNFDVDEGDDDDDIDDDDEGDGDDDDDDDGSR